jgi:hypothetical protein
MKFVIEHINGNHKASRRFRRQLTLTANSYNQGREDFTELFNFLTSSFGPSLDINTLDTLKTSDFTKAVQWSWVIEPRYDQHRFFFRDDKQLAFIKLKYGQCETHWD